MRTPPAPRSNAFISGTNAAIAKGPSPTAIEDMPIMIASIAINVTLRGRSLNESLSVFNHLLDDV